MYVKGIITQIQGYKAKIRIPEYDNFETNFLDIPQLFTMQNKSGHTPEIGALVSAVLNDDMTEGAVLGQIYNDADAAPAELGGAEFVVFSDGVSISHIPGTKKLFFNAEDIIVNSKITCSDDISCAGDISCEGDIDSKGDITAEEKIKGDSVEDKKGTMQKMRDTYNEHTHEGNLGIPTSPPETQMA